MPAPAPKMFLKSLSICVYVSKMRTKVLINLNKPCLSMCLEGDQKLSSRSSSFWHA
jgi:hypothetical protein